MRYSVSRAALAAALMSCAPIASAADTASTDSEEIVVTATRNAKGVKRDQLGSSVTIVQPKDLELRQVRVISDVLRDIPGISVSRTGTVGGLTQIRMRGAEGNHTLVLIDGMEASDVYAGEFDFATLIADDVARIEVLRGQQSALYGSDAIAGVIHYRTLSGAEDPGMSGRIEGGSFGTVDSAVRIAGIEGGLDYAISGSFMSTDGVPTSRFGVRELGAENTALSGRFAYEFSDIFTLRAIARYVNTGADTNPQNFDPSRPHFGFVVDGTSFYENEAFYGLVAGDLSLLDGAWTHSLTLQGIDGNRQNYTAGLVTSANEGSRFKASYVTAYTFGDSAFESTITGAIDYKEERYQNVGPNLNPQQALKRQIDNTGYVLAYDAVIGDNAGFGASVRHDQNDRFDNITTYRVQGTYKFDFGLRLHAAAGSGIKNPSVTELFGFNPNTFIGNPNLKPERSEGWEAGVEYAFLDGRAFIDITYFDSTLKDEIYTNFTPTFVSTPDNRLTDSKQQGVEVSAQLLLDEAWRVFASYTYLDAVENGIEEIRRPPHIASVNVSYVDPEDRFSGTLSVRYNGETLDSNFTGIGPSRIELPSFTLVNFAADARLTDEVRVYGRVENVFDEDYEEVYTFRTPGRAFYAGIRANF